MGFMDDIKKAVNGNPKDLIATAKQQINQHEVQVDKMVEKAGHLIDEKTGGKYSDKIENVEKKVQDRTGKL